MSFQLSISQVCTDIKFSTVTNIIAPASMPALKSETVFTKINQKFRFTPPRKLNILKYIKYY